MNYNIWKQGPKRFHIEIEETKTHKFKRIKCKMKGKNRNAGEAGEG
jgi:hypothetical protein